MEQGFLEVFEAINAVGAGDTCLFEECVIIGTYDGRYFKFDGIGSGIAIQKDKVLTASHNIHLDVVERGLNYVIGYNILKPKIAKKGCKACIADRNFRVVMVKSESIEIKGELALLHLENDIIVDELNFDLGDKDDIAWGKLREVTVVGYGSKNNETVQGAGCKRAAILKKVILRSKNSNVNSKNEEEFGFDSDHQFVAGDSKAGSCEGDSGGPVFKIVKGERRKLVGIILEDTINRVVDGKPPKGICGGGTVIEDIESIREFLGKE